MVVTIITFTSNNYLPRAKRILVNIYRDVGKVNIPLHSLSLRRIIIIVLKLISTLFSSEYQESATNMLKHDKKSRKVLSSRNSKMSFSPGSAEYYRLSHEVVT